MPHSRISTCCYCRYCCCSYGILLLGRAVPAIGRKAHVLVFLFMMGYMSLCHVYRIWVDYMGWTLDFTGPQMLLTIKLTSLAYNLFDGTHNKGYLKEKLDNNPVSLERGVCVWRGSQQCTAVSQQTLTRATIVCTNTFLFHRAAWSVCTKVW